MGNLIRNRIRLIFAGLLLFAETNHAIGQISDTMPDLTAGFQTYQIELETVLKLAGADNLTIKEFKQRQDIATIDQRIAKEWMIPDLFLGATLHNLNGSAMNSDGRFFREVNRNRLWAGAGIGLNLIPGDGIYQTLAAKQNALASGYLLQASKNEVILNAILVFYDLQKKQAEYKTLVNLLNYTDRISKQLKIQTDNGQQYRSVYLLARSNYNNILVALQEVIKNVHHFSAALIALLNIQDEDILLLSSVDVLLPVELLDEQIIAKGLYDSAYSRRPELQYHQSMIDSKRYDQKRVTKGLLVPQLNFYINYGTVGPYNGAAENSPSNFDSRYEKTIEVNAVVGWNIPLDLFISGGKPKKLDALIQLQRNLLDQQRNLVKREVSQALNDYRESKNQLLIAKESSEFAEEALNQSIERQKLGTAKPFEVFQAQEIYLKTVISYQNVVTNYNKAQYSLYVALGNNL